MSARPTPPQVFAAGLPPDMDARATFDPSFGLVVVVDRLPGWAFNPDYLRNGPGLERELFARIGESLWAEVRDLGERALAGETAAKAGLLLVAVILNPLAIARAERDLNRAAA